VFAKEEGRLVIKVVGEIQKKDIKGYRVYRMNGRYDGTRSCA